MPSIHLRYTAPEFKLTAESDETPSPTEQLKLVHAEVDRQRTAIAARRNTMHTRAAVLVTAAGILATFQTTSLVNGWQFISIGLSVVVAAIGLWTMWPSSGPESNPKTLFQENLMVQPYSMEWRIVDDNITALDGEKKLLGKIAMRLTIGYSILLGMWLSMVIISALKVLTWI